MVTNNTFGNQYSFFHSQPVIIIPLKSIIHHIKLKNNTIQLFFLESTTFLLNSQENNIQSTLEILLPFIEQANDSTFFDLYYQNTNNVSNLIHAYEQHIISNYDFILIFNAFNGRSVIDYQNLPLFPKSQLNIGKNSLKFKKSLNIDSLMYHFNSPDFYENKDSIKTVFSNFVKLQSFDVFSNFVYSMNSQLKGILKRPDPISSPNDHFDEINKLKGILSTSHYLFKFRCLSLKSTSISNHGTFFIADYPNNFSEVFRVFYLDKKPYREKSLSSFYFSSANLAIAFANGWLLRASILTAKLIISLLSPFRI